MRENDSMGKTTRRPSRQNRKSFGLPGSGLTVTIGASPQTKSNGQPSFDGELRLLKSSLLYADQLDLLAPSAAWRDTLAPLLHTNTANSLLTVAKLPNATLQRLGVTEISPQEFREALRMLAATSPTHPERREAEALWRPAILKLKKEATDYLHTPEGVELDMALKTGAVTLISDGTRFEDSLDQQLEWFRDRLTQALAAPSSTVLLDQVSTEYLRATGDYTEGLPSVAGNRSRRSALGTGLVERLPAFPESPMSHILEAREELTEGRATYRESVKALASKLQSSALDETLSSEIDEMWNDQVRPTLEELRKSATKTRVAVETGKRLSTEGYGVPTLLVAVANFTDIAAALPTPAAALAAVGRVAAAAAQEAFITRAAVRNHDLVYLLDINKKLGKRSGR